MSISAEWSEGYVTDTLYTDQVYREQSPAWMNYVAVVKGAMPRALDGDFSYLELGTGLGHSITIFAAAFPKARFVGVDFNPAQIDYAQRRAKALGLTNLTFIEASFQDIAADASGQGIARGLDKFDFAAMHGIYSWISEDARRAVQQIFFDRLKPGALVYNSYNCLPGWAIEAPLQRMLKEYASAASGSSADRARAALKTIRGLADTKQGYFAASPQIMSALNQYAGKEANYLAHEFLNGDWNAFYAGDVAQEMAAAKLDFLGSATFVENHGDLLLTEAAAALVNEQPNERSRQLVQDFLINQRFRRDIFVRGHARLSSAQINVNRARQCLVAPKSLAKLQPHIKLRRGTFNIDAGQFKPLVAVLSGWAAHEADFAEAFGAAGGRKHDFARLVTLMTVSQHMQPAVGVPPRPTAKAPKPGHVQRHVLPLGANKVELAAAVDKKSAVVLISPVTGGPVSCTPTMTLLLQEMMQKGGTTEDFVTRIQTQMTSQKTRLLRDGKQIDDPAAAKTYLEGLIAGYLDDEVPSLVRLGILVPQERD